MAGQGDAPKTFAEVQHEMRRWGCEYPHAGYGGMFRRWLHAENPKPYGSFGNGSAMRVAAAGWLFDTLDKTLEMAKVTAEVTHNHPEGIKGAQATAAAIFLARTGHSKPEIKQYGLKVSSTYCLKFSLLLWPVRPPSAYALWKASGWLWVTSAVTFAISSVYPAYQTASLPPPPAWPWRSRCQSYHRASDFLRAATSIPP